MKVRIALEFTFDGYDELDPETVKKSIVEQMEIADVYFTVNRPNLNDLPMEVSPSRIEVLASTVEKPPEVTVTIKEFNQEMFVKYMGDFISCIKDRYIGANLEPALKDYLTKIKYGEHR